MKEREIADILYNFPHLIDPQFLNEFPKREYLFPNTSRADLVFFGSSEIIVVELKKDVLKQSAVLQLWEYLASMKQKFPNKKIRGILIGESLDSEATRLLQTSTFPIEVKLLGRDIPTAIKICQNCRRANEIREKTCKFCGAYQWIPFKR
jgi:RecB family endonuclease NucS